MKRNLIGACAALATLGLTFGTATQAQEGSYPNRPIMLVVSAAAGGTTSMIGRLG
jgi:tripartite-type tricarboxylate transporter receptor subunit TctC